VRPEQVVAIDRQGARGLGRVSNLTYRGAVAEAVAGDGAPESSAMGAARGKRRDREARDVALARQIAMREAAAMEEQAINTSKDAELAMLLVAKDARERCVDQEVALRAQGGPVVQANGESGALQAQREVGVNSKGKEVVQAADQTEVERALGWEHRLSSVT
jgi:hypothetical protein